MQDNDLSVRLYQYFVKKTLDTMKVNLDRIANQHYLAIGGLPAKRKSFLDDIANITATDTEISKNWFPVRLEGDYENISSPGAFWALVYFNLITFIGEKSLKRNEYKSFTSLKRLMKHNAPKLIYKKSVANLSSIANQYKRKIIVLVDDFDVLLEKLKLRDGWAIRYVLMHNPEIMLVANTMTSWSPTLWAYKAPLYGMFGYLNFSISPL